MKRKSVLLALLFIASVQGLLAQKANHFNPEKEKKELMGYTIRLVPMPAKTFGFAIMKGDKPVYAQRNNPFTGDPIGLKSKEDAFKLAEWVVNEDAKNGKRPVRITRDVAVKLNLPKH